MTVPEIEIVDAGVGRPAADFGGFFRAEYPGLVALATAVTGDRQTGEDIAAEAMTRAYRRWSTVGGYERPGAWTRRVAVNLLHSRRRRLASEVRGRLRLGHRGQSDGDRADDVVGADHFHRLVAPLAPRQRTAVALRYLDDLTVDEIADLMGCAPGTVKSHLHAARAAITERLGDPRPGDTT